MQKPQVIISLTSFPAAIPYATRAIQSLLESSVLPDKIVLYLTYAQFPESKVPQVLLEMAENNKIFEIRNYDDEIRSYRKLLPALKDFPEAAIVTVDDDVWYHKHMLRDLLTWHEQMPNMIIAHRAKHIKANAPYRQWAKYRWYHFLFKKLQPSFMNLSTGVGGVLYPPHALRTDMIEEFRALVPTNDDFGFWAAAVINGTKILPVPFGPHNKPRGLKKPKELSLKTTNFKSGVDVNRKAFEEIVEKYPEIKKRIQNYG
ncbi:glycosyltransferase [Bacteroides sp. 214]|uniref:glycosyltransferase n=1 Tax=Bacteroides sp. 214 TaxID=2302935 RepID=UPI0013D4A63B|nr:glycosyltransferase [Bacteroides sp. 214]NDW11724.1 glycosyltransferase [Bacteroides sp. 214]